MNNAKSRWLALLLALALAGCGGSEPADTAGDAGQMPGESPAPAEAASEGAPPPMQATAADAPLRVEDVDAYATGMGHELELLQAAVDKVAQARAADDDEAEASALIELAMGDVETPAARAAGVDPARYSAIKSRINRAIGAVGMQRELQAMGGDPAAMTPEEVAQQEQARAQLQAQVGDPYAGIDTAVVAALQARFDELAQLNAQSIAIRMNAGG